MGTTHSRWLLRHPLHPPPSPAPPKEHKEDDMVDTRHKTCMHPGCTLFPCMSAVAPPPPSPVPASDSTSHHNNTTNNNNHNGKRATATRRAAKKKKGTFNVNAGPSDRRTVGNDGDGDGDDDDHDTNTAAIAMPARYCAAHAPAGAVNVAASRCRHPGCSVQPSFGREGAGEPASYCARHRKRGMTDVKNPRCLARGCVAQPRCGRPGDSRAGYCLRHAAPDMVNVRWGDKGGGGR